VVIKEFLVDQEDEHIPPAWFTSYMAKFKDQVVKEAVEKICLEFSERFCLQKQQQVPPPEPAGMATQVPEISSTATHPDGRLSPCQACLGCTTGVYQCSVCPSYTLCELCSFQHDPSHSLVKLRTAVPLGEYGEPVVVEQRFQKRMDRSFRKAEKQRLKAEKRQLKAEVKEIKKQLRMERRSLQWSSASDGAGEPVLLQPRGTPASQPESPKQSCTPVVPTMTAVFLDENLPDGTRLQPGTRFIKYWRMRNTGTVSWTSDTKLKFMWGNLDLATSEKKEVAVPFLQPGQVGVVCVEFVAPVLEGTYTSHWRLAHRGEQFGPRVWCSIVVDPLQSADYTDLQLTTPCSQLQASGKEFCSDVEQPHSSHKEDMCCSGMGLTPQESKILYEDRDQDYYIPSVDLLTAQDLLSFELLDINIVQELERVPHNTPVDMTPCMSPLPHDGPLLEKPGLGLIEEEAESSGLKTLLDVSPGGQQEMEGAPAQEEGDEDISGTQFVCETVIRSLTLEEAPDHKPLRRRPGSQKTSYLVHQDIFSCAERSGEQPSERRALPVVDVEVKSVMVPVQAVQEDRPQTEECPESDSESICVEAGSERGGDEELPQDDRDEVRSQGSSTSSEDYIIILPDCFDTSRPLGESMYSSALSQPGAGGAVESDLDAEQLCLSSPEEEDLTLGHSVNDMLCASQTLDTVPLTPEVVPTPAQLQLTSGTPTLRGEGPAHHRDHNETELAVEALPSPELYREEAVEGSSPVQSLPVSPCGNTISRQHSSQDLRDPCGEADRKVSITHLLIVCYCSKCVHVACQGAIMVFENALWVQLQLTGPCWPHGGIAGGLVKGALSVAASAYKALFTGQPVPAQPPVDSANQQATMMAVLLEMGFGDRQLNQRLLKKHNYNLLDVVNELVQLTDNDWYSARY
ncbi:NBR1 protein, partial [Amia calva]|nr:NBR1 protein [Amia calva]